MDIRYVNENDIEVHFWKHNYLITLHNAGSYKVNADNDQDAMDYLIDYIEQKNYKGLIMSREEEHEEEYLENYPQGGNHGLILTIPWHEISIEIID